MNRDLQIYYENYFHMFGLPGWKQLMKDTQDVVDTLANKALNDVTTLETLYYLKGQGDHLRRLLNFEPALRNTYDNIIYQEENKDVDVV